MKPIQDWRMGAFMDFSKTEDSLTASLEFLLWHEFRDFIRTPLLRNLNNVIYTQLRGLPIESDFLHPGFSPKK